MKTYRIVENFEDYGLLVIDTSAILEAFGDFGFDELRATTTNVSDQWPKPWGAFYDMHSTEPEALSPPDVYVWNDALLVLSSKAKLALEPLIKGFGEFLSFQCNGDSYFVFSCQNVVLADQDVSEELIEGGLPCGIKNLQFLPEAIGTRSIFKTPFDQFSAIYCTEAFMREVERQQLKGVSFTEDLSRRIGV